MRRLHLLFIFARLAVLNELQYRSNFLAQLLQSVLELGMSLAGLAVVFGYTDTLGGWSPEELVVLVGVYTLVRGMVRLIIQPSLQQFMADVRLGTFDFTLTKPENAQLLVSVQRLQITELVDVVVGLGVVFLALAQWGTVITLGHIVAFVVALLAGLTIVYSFLLTLATLSFWFVRLEYMLSLFTIMYQAGQWPPDIYPRGLRSMLTFLVPIAFAVTVPAGALAGRVTWPTLLRAMVLALIAFLGSCWFWEFGVRHYSGASA